MGLCRLIRRLSYCFKLSKIASNLEIHLASIQYFQELLRICNGNIEDKNKNKLLINTLSISISRTELEKTRVGTQTQSNSVGSKRTGTQLRFWELSDSQLTSWNVPRPLNYPEQLFQDNICLTLMFFGIIPICKEKTTINKTK